MQRNSLQFSLHTLVCNLCDSLVVRRRNFEVHLLRLLVLSWPPSQMQELLSRQLALRIKKKRKMKMMMMMRIFLSTSWILMRRLELPCCSYASAFLKNLLFSIGYCDYWLLVTKVLWLTRQMFLLFVITFRMWRVSACPMRTLRIRMNGD